ncbi:D-sedoheptulose 7-phosphate isomerase [Hoeflea sp.]|uniref:D-sedoheptulose 7-phosphate isomerase n=1 Tax=Hoeflea sp. TaxID=1940281 RepID=UPI003B528FA2
MDLRAFYSSEFEEHRDVAAATGQAVEAAFLGSVAACTKALESGNKLMFFGNGGSAADAQHLATELTVRYKNNRRALAAIALTTDTSALTAIGNDFGFDQLFSRQIEAIGKSGDVAIAISTSGKSPNVTEALKAARSMGMVTIALSGKGGGEIPDLADHLMLVPSNTTARIQEMHILLGQMLCNAIEYELGVAE